MSGGDDTETGWPRAIHAKGPWGASVVTRGGNGTARSTSGADHDLMREAAGRRARDEAQVLDRLVETLRLASFRRYLDATVRSMSAIVPDVLATAESDVASALQRIRPGHLWPMSTASRRAPGHPETVRPTGRASSRRAAGNECAAAYRSSPLIGDAIIAEGAPGDWIEASIVGDSLEIVLRSDGYELSTHAGAAHLKLGGRLPDTVIAACVGRPLEDVVDHPLLHGRGYVVGRAAQIGKASALTFEVGRRPLRMPWRQ